MSASICANVRSLCGDVSCWLDIEIRLFRSSFSPLCFLSLPWRIRNVDGFVTAPPLSSVLFARRQRRLLWALLAGWWLIIIFIQLQHDTIQYISFLIQILIRRQQKLWYHNSMQVESTARQNIYASLVFQSDEFGRRLEQLLPNDAEISPAA